MLDSADKRQLDRIEAGLAELIARALCADDGRVWAKVSTATKEFYRARSALPMNPASNESERAANALDRAWEAIHAFAQGSGCPAGGDTLEWLSAKTKEAWLSWEAGRKESANAE